VYSILLQQRGRLFFAAPLREISRLSQANLLSRNVAASRLKPDPSPSSVIPVTLDAQIPRAVVPGVVREFGALGGMTALAGHHLAGSWVEDLFTDRMSEL
jgi:hypothetical protein